MYCWRFLLLAWQRDHTAKVAQKNKNTLILTMLCTLRPICCLRLRVESHTGGLASTWSYVPEASPASLCRCLWPIPVTRPHRVNWRIDAWNPWTSPAVISGQFPFQKCTENLCFCNKVISRFQWSCPWPIHVQKVRCTSLFWLPKKFLLFAVVPGARLCTKRIAWKSNFITWRTPAFPGHRPWLLPAQRQGHRIWSLCQITRSLTKSPILLLFRTSLNDGISIKSVCTSQIVACLHALSRNCELVWRPTKVSEYDGDMINIDCTFIRCRPRWSAVMQRTGADQGD